MGGVKKFFLDNAVLMHAIHIGLAVTEILLIVIDRSFRFSLIFVANVVKFGVLCPCFHSLSHISTDMLTHDIDTCSLQQFCPSVCLSSVTFRYCIETA